MSVVIPVGNREPQRIAAGDNLSWTRTITNYPSTNWALTYVIRGPRRIYRFNANANAGAFTVTLDSNVTANWTPGLYAIGAFVTQGSEQVQVKCAFPRLEVTPNLNLSANNTVKGTDPRSWAEQTLAVVEDTITKLLNRTVASANVNGNAYTLANISELYTVRERLKSEVRRQQQQEKLNAGCGASNKIGVRFKPIGLAGYPPQVRVPWQ